MKIVERYINWIDSEIENRYVNHNHKEKMAWLATAGYLSVIVLTNATSSYRLDLWHQIILSFLLLLACYVTCVFVNMQFRRRWIAADECHVLRNSRAEITKMLNIEDSDLKLDVINEENTSEIPQWPEFIQKGINDYKKKSIRPHFIEKIGLMFCPCKLSKSKSRVKSEFASFWIIFIATAIAIAPIWIKKTPSNNDLESKISKIEKKINTIETKCKKINQDVFNVKTEIKNIKENIVYKKKDKI